MKKYTALEKILHRQFLGNSTVSNYLFNRILEKAKKHRQDESKNHIFVTGLARSGTTALLNKIYSSGEVSSFVYKYMPFTLSPKLAEIFSNFSNKSKTTDTVRFHNDGININIDSPECLDEIFWIKSKHLFNEELKNSEEFKSQLINAYSYYLDSFSFIDGDKKMIIKNNNNHTRLIELTNYFKDSTFILMIREPLAHANSLLNQHLNFLNLQNNDPFILEYMNLIGHNEFGKNAIPFEYIGIENSWHKNLSKNSLDYWITQWIKTYQWILNSNFIKRENILIVPYERLCKENSFYKKICKKINIVNHKSGLQFKSANKYFSSKMLIKNDDLVSKSKMIYDDLFEKSNF